MKLGFTELPSFMRFRDKFIEDRAFYQLQNELMENPDRGDVMSGCGGFRKIRLQDSARGKGKRGGIRVIYMYVPEVSRLVFVFGYSKDLMTDISPDDKKQLALRAKILKAEEIEEAGYSHGNN